jgi:hypothetical protein
MPRQLLTFALVALVPAGSWAQAAGGQRCPAAQYLPQLTIDTIHEPAVPVLDTWQILWGDVPLSDSQLAMLAHDDVFIDRTRAEMQSRGVWVYLGTILAATGTALSSAGWVLYGQDELSQSVTLSIAMGGVLLGALGLVTVTQFVQTPLEPHLAPVPEHRLTRDEARDLVARVNRQLYREICEAAELGRDAPTSRPAR